MKKEETAAAPVRVPPKIKFTDPDTNLIKEVAEKVEMDLINDDINPIPPPPPEGPKSSFRERWEEKRKEKGTSAARLKRMLESEQNPLNDPNYKLMLTEDDDFLKGLGDEERREAVAKEFKLEHGAIAAASNYAKVIKLKEQNDELSKMFQEKSNEVEDMTDVNQFLKTSLQELEKINKELQDDQENNKTIMKENEKLSNKNLELQETVQKTKALAVASAAALEVKRRAENKIKRRAEETAKSAVRMTEAARAARAAAEQEVNRANRKVAEMQKQFEELDKRTDENLESLMDDNNVLETFANILRTSDPKSKERECLKILIDKVSETNL